MCFAQRWIPCAAILLLLALPLPDVKARNLPLPILVLCTVFSIATAHAWFRFNKEELGGLRAALKALPENTRVLGLDYAKQSVHIKGWPFVQTFAYAQAYRGCELNFSFAKHMSGIVVLRAGQTMPWTQNLEFFAERVAFTDFKHFDYVLLNTSREKHEIWINCPSFHPITHAGRWRLYQVDQSALDDYLEWQESLSIPPGLTRI